MIADNPLNTSGFMITSQLGSNDSHIGNIFPSKALSLPHHQQQQNKTDKFTTPSTVTTSILPSTSSSSMVMMNSNYSPLITSSTSHRSNSTSRQASLLSPGPMDSPGLKSNKFQLKINVLSKISTSSVTPGSNSNGMISTSIPGSFQFDSHINNKRFKLNGDDDDEDEDEDDSCKMSDGDEEGSKTNLYSPFLFLNPNEKSKRCILGEREYNEAFAEGRIIGTGSDSIVKEVMYRRTGERMACKIIPKNSSSLRVKNLEQDIKVLMAIRHPNIISLKKVYETSTDFKFVMELASGGDLYEKIIEKERYFEPETCQVMLGILSAVAYLHDQGIIHRDIKPENFLLASKESETYVKLADFGTAKITFHENNNEYNAADFMDVDGRESFDVFDDSRVSSSYSSSSTSSASRARAFSGVGSNYYVAPEILLGDGYDKQVDMWSIGVVMYVLLCGSPPFHEGVDGDEHKSYKNIIQGKFSFSDPCWNTVSDFAKDLIQRLLTVDPEKRLTAHEALNHPWFKMRQL